MAKKTTTSVRKKRTAERAKIMIGMGTCGLGAGAKGVLKCIEKEIKRQKLIADIIPTGCIGLCTQEVLVDVILPGRTRVTYKNVEQNMVSQILEEHVRDGKVVKKYALSQMYLDGKDVTPYKDLPFFDELEVNKNQLKYVTRNCGIIDPDSIEEYIEQGGYLALKKVIKTMLPDEVVNEVSKSGLRGRGGGGFSAGWKWGSTAKYNSDEKYIICNADEGDPGAFMDRSLLEGDPHAVLEGMIIAG